MNIPLCVFSWPLANLTLRGGKGLPPAWGPVLHTDPTDGGPWVNTGEWAWNPNEQRCVRRDRAGYFIFDGDRRWSLPLDADSPWPARLAMISTWLADPSRVMPSYVRDNGDGTISLVAWDGSNILWEARWTTGGVAVEPTDRPGLNLPTLAQHLQAYPLIVALPLALYDMPEVRARVAL